MNTVERVSIRNGWIAMLTRENPRRALERRIGRMNENGYKVAAVVPYEGHRGLLMKLLTFALGCVTLGFYWPSSGMLIVGEAID